ncbi:TetR/AcrR family transcriptional regulator [Luteipulveratus halotolerans]|uniref:HTH tetR-type domain-containing protein n=1 Tax=Luteipulveratus halotolerans TaxID=1631356 RepID=A0A0L6CHW6_9MICO|nr:TetR/AcrR family transcriptional regulator [Luteipulveratus halotolerans]KNX37396.1 hypothetical protein VV01_09925 [Luteipulveratus halotolerans]
MPRQADPTTRDRILRTSTRLFYREGVQAVGMARIIDEAGCGKNALYRHFPSKSDLVTAYLDEFAIARDEAASAALDGVDDPAQALITLTRQIAADASHRSFRGCAIRNYLRETPPADDTAARRARTCVRRWRRRIDHLVGELGVADPKTLADRIWLIHEGLYADGRRSATVAVDLVEELITSAKKVG